MAQRKGIDAVFVEAATSRVDQVLCSSDPARYHINFINSARKKVLCGKLKMCLLENAVCALYDALNPVFQNMYFINYLSPTVCV